MSDKQLTAPPTEQALLDHLTALKTLYLEVQSLVRSGYDGPFIGEEVRGVISAYITAEQTAKSLK